MRKRTMAKGGGVVVLIAALATWLSGLFDGMGLGPGDGAGLGTGRPIVTEPEGPPDDLEVSHTDRADVGEHGGVLQELRVLEVVVAGSGYEVRREIDGKVRFQRVELPQVKALAARTTGTDEGIRVLIYRRESALPHAERELDEALADAGIEDSEIVRREELLPAPTRSPPGHG